MQHNLELIPGVEPTCTSTGTKDLYKCKNCEKLFHDAEGNEPYQYMSGEDFLGAKPHTYETIHGREADCYSVGYKDCYKCTTCDNYFKDKNNNSDSLIGNEFEYNEWKSKTGNGYLPIVEHNLNTVIEEKPDCTHDGFKGCYVCRSCGSYFENQNGKAEIQDINSWRSKNGVGFVSTLGHDYAIEYKWTNDNECIAEVECKRCGYTETIKSSNVEENDGKYVALFKEDFLEKQYKDTNTNAGLIVGIVCGSVALVGIGVLSFISVKKKRTK